MSTQEAANLMEYLGGPVTTKYGATRAALGHPVPWTQTFARIHLEFGNEAWNTAQPGATMPISGAYAGRTNLIFRTIRGSQWFSATRFNLIANTQAVWDGRTIELLQTMREADMLDIAPYLFSSFNDDSSIEHIYDHLQAHAAATAEHPVHLAVYEVNLGTTAGTASQASIDATVPSVGAGITVLEHELLMLRDLGITVQNTFQLGGGDYHFDNTAGTNKHETTPLWGVVVDMGGASNRVRPVFLAQQLVNEAIRPEMLTTFISGDNPAWNQPHSANDNVALDNARELQSFAFANASSTTLIVVNLSRTSARTVGLGGACSPRGRVRVETLTSAKITDSNELQENVKIATREEMNIVPATSVFTLPTFSMTSFSSSNAGCLAAR
jgi:alpha-L-arabinofuranosidase